MLLYTYIIYIYIYIYVSLVVLVFFCSRWLFLRCLQRKGFPKYPPLKALKSAQILPLWMLSVLTWEWFTFCCMIRNPRELKPNHFGILGINPHVDYVALFPCRDRSATFAILFGDMLEHDEQHNWNCKSHINDTCMYLLYMYTQVAIPVDQNPRKSRQCMRRS